jgi:SynChlorMet cassette protein ScmC
MRSGLKSKTSDTEFVLELGGGICWSFITTPDTRSWVEKFAAVIGLSVNNRDMSRSSIRMFFVQGSWKKGGCVGLNPPVFSKIKTDLPTDGWNGVDFGALRLWTHKKIQDIVCEIDQIRSCELDIIKMWTALYGIYLRSFDSGGLILHGALVEQNGRGALLAGSGGAGKSTLSRRLPSDWHVLSDDQSLVVLNDQNRYMAHPVPTWSERLWRGSTQNWNIQCHVPLTAIFFIEQSPSDKVVPMGRGQAAVRINDSSTEVINPIWWNMDTEEKTDIKKKIFDNASDMARAVPAYILRNSLNGRCWNEMEKVL